ncbi:MAG: response regulator transcription factor [Candidatus Baltobacteraceae bacterium]
MIRVVIVDDHPVVRDGLAANLGDAGDVQVVGTAGDIAAARELVRRERPDVLLLDLELPDGNGLDAIATLRAIEPKLGIVVFTAYGGENRIERAIAAGGDSYVLKGTPSDELVAIVRAVSRGETQLPTDVAGQLARAVRAPRALRLTDREREILALVAAGHSNRAIAERLGIGERTVKFHVSEILARLGAGNRAQAVALATERGLL